MNEIIPVKNSADQTVSARELHASLGIGRCYATWVRERVKSAGLVEGRDFRTAVVPLGVASGGRRRFEVTLTRDAAQRLEELETLRRSFRRAAQPGGVYVYFVRAVGVGRIKIGTAANVQERLRTLQRASPVDLEVLATTPGNRRLEFALHRRFAAERVAGGEWFESSARLLGYIDSIRRRPSTADTGAEQ